MIPHATQPKLGRDIDVPLVVSGASMFANLFGNVLVLDPDGTAVYAFNRSRFALCPLVKASLVDIVPACSFAPQNFLTGLEFHDAHGTIILDRLALSGV